MNDLKKSSILKPKRVILFLILTVLIVAYISCLEKKDYFVDAETGETVHFLYKNTKFQCYSSAWSLAFDKITVDVEFRDMNEDLSVNQLSLKILKNDKELVPFKIESSDPRYPIEPITVNSFDELPNDYKNLDSSVRTYFRYNHYFQDDLLKDTDSIIVHLFMVITMRGKPLTAEKKLHFRRKSEYRFENPIRFH